MSTPSGDRPERICFITGRLAECALRATVERLAAEFGIAYEIAVLPITVAALMSPSWIAKQLVLSENITRAILPGYCEGDLASLQSKYPEIVFERGPRDLRSLPHTFGKTVQRDAFYGQFDIEILAEINHAPRLTFVDILARAERYRTHGADVIDVGCIPGNVWHDVDVCVRMLRAEGFRVSIDSLDPTEISKATAAGAELVLSVNASNREYAVDWGAEVVVIPDDIPTLGGLEQSIEFLTSRGVRVRLDPVLEPIGFGFATSLGRYMQVRRDFPEAEIMMGIGNLTELTDVDSAGINVLLLAICQELGIRSVLTTEVINWASTSVQECDLARRLVHYAQSHGVPPKHLEPRLVTLRDPKVPTYDDSFFAQLAAQIRDHNYRIFATGEVVHVVSAGLHLTDRDPFHLFEQLLQRQQLANSPAARSLEAAHAFYLGYEMAKAHIANTLQKDYRQDEALDWGYLTQPEDHHRLKLSASGQARKSQSLPEGEHE